MNNLSKNDNSILNKLINKYQKKTPKLSLKLKKIFQDEYKMNRENKIISIFEKWIDCSSLMRKP